MDIMPKFVSKHIYSKKYFHKLTFFCFFSSERLFLTFTQNANIFYRKVGLRMHFLKNAICSEARKLANTLMEIDTYSLIISVNQLFKYTVSK